MRSLWILSAVFLLITDIQLDPASTAYAGNETGPVRVAVLDFELVDTSLEGASYGVDEAETGRLKLISDLLRDLLAKSDEYEVADLAPAAAQIADAGFIHSCNGCEIAIARSLGADRVITGTVHKVSTLILGIQISEHDVSTGKVLRVMAAQIRGNTDESWMHGMRWLVRNRLLAK